jgi:PAS domain S-box-containing protein
MYERQRQPGRIAVDSATHSKQLWEDGDGLRVSGAEDADSGWMTLFFNAFRRSKNAMVLLDEQRRVVEVNGAALQLAGRRRAELIGRHAWEFVVGGPVYSEREWKAALRESEFAAVGDIRRGDGGRVTVECACHPALVTARRLVLFVAVTTNRRGRQPRVEAAGARDAIPLSARELDIVRLIAEGASGTEIAEELQITHNTVRTHVRNSMKKLDTRSQAHLIAKLLGEGLLWAERK